MPKQSRAKAHGLRTWIEIDTNALKKNYAVFRGLITPACKLMAVTKSNAYGHDFIEYARSLQHLGIDSIGVDSITEALALREAGITKPILVLGYTLPVRFREAMHKHIALTVSQFESLAYLNKNRQDLKGLRIHIKIDTGMHRQGFDPDRVPEVIRQLQKLRGIHIEGVYTHFAAAKNPAFRNETDQQAQRFIQVCERFRSAGFEVIQHASATAGTIIFPECHFDMVRVGIGLYGYWPSKETRAAFGDRLKLRPLLTWKTIIGEIKNIAKGAGTGYDLAEKVSRDSTIAICPIGYWHGYPRALSSIGHIIVRGQRAKVLGRVSMDMIVIDITDINKIKVGDEVMLIGDGITADELAHLSDTTAYEILTRLNPLIKRIYG